MFGWQIIRVDEHFCVWTHKASVLPRRLNTHMCHQSHAFQTHVPTVHLEWPLAQTYKLSVWTHTSDWNLFVLRHSHTPQIQFRVTLGVTCVCVNTVYILYVCCTHTLLNRNLKAACFVHAKQVFPTENSGNTHVHAHKRKHTVFFFINSEIRCIRYISAYLKQQVRCPYEYWNKGFLL